MAHLGPKRVGSGSGAACAVWMTAALSATGCFVTIADPARERDTVTGSGGTGGTPPGSGGAMGGGAAGADGGNPVRDGGAPDGAAGTCKPGWVDCDGRPENGCEVDFGNAERPTPAIALGMKPTLDGDPGEWAALPRYGMIELCPECNATQPGGQAGEPIVNAPFGDADFQSQFKVAWDSFALYVLAEVRDDDITALDPLNPERQDGIELLLDGVNQGSRGYDPDDHHLFIGAQSESFVEKDRPNVLSSALQIKTRIQASCYFVEVRLPWPYVMATTHVPKVADIHGFTIAANDWDTPTGDAKPAPVREDQIFSVDPKESYAFDTASFGDLRLE